MNPDRIRNIVCAWPTCTETIVPFVGGYRHDNPRLDLEHPACRDTHQVHRYMAVQKLIATVILDNPQFTAREWRKGMDLAINPKTSDLFPDPADHVSHDELIQRG